MSHAVHQIVKPFEPRHLKHWAAIPAAAATAYLAGPSILSSLGITSGTAASTVGLTTPIGTMYADIPSAGATAGGLFGTGISAGTAAEIAGGGLLAKSLLTKPKIPAMPSVAGGTSNVGTPIPMGEPIAKTGSLKKYGLYTPTKTNFGSGFGSNIKLGASKSLL